MNTDTAISLDDKYRLDRSRALVNGRQALVRVLLAQRALDRARGLNTAGFVSGYRGSPLGSFDVELTKAAQILARNDVSFEPGLNEDLALTALAGTQQLDFLPGRKVDGVFALWYGKGPGVDRSGDAIKHANLAGVSPHGGLVLAFGDDHAGKSSTTAHQSDITLASWDVPVLYPASVSEIVEYGLAAFAMSRYTGGLVGLKLVNETAEATSVLDQGDPPVFAIPADPGDVNVHIRAEVRAMLDQDARIVRHKLPRASAFAHANGLDRITYGARAPTLLIATAGKSYPDTLAALEILGITDEVAARIGIGVYKIALIFPLDGLALLAAARSAHEVFFVEEKRAHAEAQAKAIFYNTKTRPSISGKADPSGAPLLPGDFPLDAATIARALASRIEAVFADIEATAPQFAHARDALRRSATPIAPPAVRRPAFCPGCPHNTSTKLPDGSFQATGIGCHGMVLFHAERRPIPMGHMGAEGANWIGLSRFSTTPHIFQNLGDGTYSHSGSLAIRAAQAAGVNITYKILYNDAVAMTGGQPVEGALTVRAIAAQVLAEGVRQVFVLSEDPARFTGADELPQNVELRHRDELMAVQETLRRVRGVSVIIYDQVCAAEKRRRRKAKTWPDPDRRIFINTDVCEGCGDCSVQSNCLAVQPTDTELGRKRKIDQSACNKDFSCTKGFCPSFVVVEGAKPRRRTGEAATPPVDIVVPDFPASGGFDLVLAGVGGTGITTVGALLGMAARIEGLDAHLYDMTGLSQKGGAVFSHVRLRRANDAPPPARIGANEADTILACDLVASVHPEITGAIAPGHTLIVANSNVTATADFQIHRDLEIAQGKLIDTLSRAAKEAPALIDATALSEKVTGDSISANVLMLGYAWQSGGIPLSRASIEKAIDLNGRDVKANHQAFTAGRSAAMQAKRPPQQPQSLDEFIARRVVDLGNYWRPAYADRYQALMDSVRQASARVEGGDAYAWAMARSAFKLMAYKDEYEVARLYTDGRFRAALDREFDGAKKIRVQLSPPLFAGKDPNTGRPRKISMGGWVFPVFRILAALKGLREGPLDLFGASEERRVERALRDAFLSRAAEVTARLDADGLENAIAFAQAPMQVRGYGPVKAGPAADLLAKLARTSG